MLNKRKEASANAIRASVQKEMAKPLSRGPQEWRTRIWELPEFQNGQVPPCLASSRKSFRLPLPSQPEKAQAAIEGETSVWKTQTGHSRFGSR
jgi:hypothetical protein